MNAWISKPLLRDAVSVSAPSNQVLGDTGIGYPSAKHFIAAIKVSNVVGTVNLIIRSRIGNEAPVVAKTSGALVNGMNYLKLSIDNATDEPNLPLLPLVEIVINGTGSCDVEKVWAVKED